MKNLKKLTAMLSAAVLLGSNAIPAQLTGAAAEDASALWYWGTASGETFKDMELLDHKGMFGDSLLYLRHVAYDTFQFVTDPETGESEKQPAHYEKDQLYRVKPRKDKIRFILRENVDSDAADQQITAIVQKYFPDTEPDKFWKPGIYDIYEADEAKRTEEASEALMHDLAGAGLISAFYTWGETADYNLVSCSNFTEYLWNSFHEQKVHCDWNAVEAWVHAEHPECEFVCITQDDTELAKQFGLYYEEAQSVMFSDTVYIVVPPEGTTFREHFALAAELYEQFGISSGYTSPASVNEPLIGQNALAAAGDVNLDCSVDVADAVLTARFCGEDREAVITDQGRLNADVTQDGSVDTNDTAMILQYIAKKISAKEMRRSSTAAYAFQAQYIRTDAAFDTSDAYPNTKLITSRSELDEHLAGLTWYDTDAIQKYTEEWFRTNKLLLVQLEESSGSISHAVTEMTADTVKINRFLPEVCTCDMAYWDILIELDQAAQISGNIRVECKDVNLHG